MKLDVNKILDTSNIAEGEVFKSYRQLCAALNQPILAGDSKIRQLKYFQRYFTYIRDKNKYIITEVFNKPLAPTRIVKTKYYEMNSLMDQLLINDLLSKPNNTWIYPNTIELFKLLGYYKQDVNISHTVLTTYEFNNYVPNYYNTAFHRNVFCIFYNQLNVLLHSLQQRGVIELYRTYTGVVTTPNHPKQYYNFGIEKSKILEEIYYNVTMQYGKSSVLSRDIYKVMFNEFTKQANEKTNNHFNYYHIGYQLKLNSIYDYAEYKLSYPINEQRQLVANHIASLVYNKLLIGSEHYINYAGYNNYSKAQEQLIQKYISESYVAPKITNILQPTSTNTHELQTKIPHTERHLII